MKRTIATLLAAAAILSGALVTFADAQGSRIRCTTYTVGGTTYTNCN